MDNYCVDDALELEQLSSIVKELDLLDSINEEIDEERLGVLHLDLLHKKKVKSFQVKFRFLKMLSCRFPLWDCCGHHHFSLNSIVTTIEDMCKNEGNNEIFTQWNAKMNSKILECMAKIKIYGKHITPISPMADIFTPNKTLQYLDVIHGEMNDLVERGVDEFAPVKSHIKTLEEILFLLRRMISFTPQIGKEKYEEALHLEFFVHHWANKAASMKLLSWLNGEHEEKIRHFLHKDNPFTPEFITFHLDFLHKANPFTPEFIRLCFGLVKVQKMKRSDYLIFREFVSRFVDFFLENAVFTSKNDVREAVHREWVNSLIVFLADPPTNTMHPSDLSFFQQKTHSVFYQDLRTMGMTTVHLQESVDKISRGIVPINAHPPRSYFPLRTVLFPFRSLLKYIAILEGTMNKNKKVDPVVNRSVFTIIKEALMPIGLVLQDMWKIQNDLEEEVKVMWDQIISLSYQADLAIKSSFLIDPPIWYSMTSLSLIVDKIKYIQNKVMTITDSHIYGTEAVAPIMSSVDVFEAPTSTSIAEVVVGFKQETRELIDRLTRGTENVDIVSIVGMGGIGKTTLAKKLFNETSIIRHFQKRAFCSVSRDYTKRKVLLHILSDLRTTDDEVRQMSDDDLAHMLKKCLSGCKYLIVMDDIWDIDAWYDVRTSFPNESNGSRVIFTTRLSSISLKENSVFNSHMLPFLSADDSWELLRHKIFHNDPCPPHLCELGKLIAEKCQGLPLAIVLIAGLLTRTERSLSHWNEVAEALTTFAFSEGCKDFIRLSYKQLPGPMKSCFLYLGAFHEDQKIKAKMMTKLWVAEGFVLKSDINSCLLKVAKKYLNQLGDTNLVTVTKRSCNGDIKHFHVHDLIRDFCKIEAQEKHCLCFINSPKSKLSIPSVCDQCRVFIEDEWRSLDSKPKDPTVHSLLHYSKDFCVAKSFKSFLCNFRLVQVLDLQMQVEVDGGFPTAVTTLVHLRYLALRLHMLETEKIPSEISNLRKLETLLILGTKVQFPCDIWKMKRLGHVETDDEAHVL